MIEMKFLKLALTLAMLWTAPATCTTAQVVKQSTSNVNNVNKAKTSSPVANDPAPQYYELRCRGGVTYHTDNTYHLPVAQKLDFFFTEGRPTREAPNVRMMNMQVNFFPGTESVGSTGGNLESGQCSWLDRGFRPGEPFIILQEIVYGRMPTRDNSPTAAEQFPDSANVPEYLKDPNHYWSFFVRIAHNKGIWGGDIFEATSSRYWKPLNINQEIRTPRSKTPAEVKKPIH
jgi:hypothetical protein